MNPKFTNATTNTDYKVFTLQDMEDLLKLYQATNEIEKGLCVLTGDDRIYGYNDGAVGKLSYIVDMIYRHSSPLLKSPDESNPVYHILEDDDMQDMDITEKAKKLMGIDEE